MEVEKKKKKNATCLEKSNVRSCLGRHVFRALRGRADG